MSSEIIEKILVPVDYSEYSMLALRYAIKIACTTDAKIELLHAYYSPAFDLISLTGNNQTQIQLRSDVIKNLETSEKESVQKLINELKPYCKSCKYDINKISYSLIPGMAEEAILNHCQEFVPDLVIMGTRGKDKRANSILGSVTEVIINKLKFPVLAIPEHYEFIGGENVNNILYVTSFDESDFISIRKLMKFTKPMKLKVFLIHIADKRENWDVIKMEGLREYFKKAYGELKVEIGFVSNKDLLKDIEDYVLQNNIHIVSITTRKRNLINRLFKPDITKKLFYHTNLPLLVFHS